MPAPQWDSATDRPLTVREVTQQLIYALKTGGELEAAAPLNQLGDIAEAAARAAALVRC
jgi:hypothetical protein